MRMFIKKPKYKATATGFTSIWKVNGKKFDEYGKITLEKCIDSAEK